MFRSEIVQNVIVATLPLNALLYSPLSAPHWVVTYLSVARTFVPGTPSCARRCCKALEKSRELPPAAPRGVFHTF